MPLKNQFVTDEYLDQLDVQHNNQLIFNTFIYNINSWEEARQLSW